MFMDFDMNSIYQEITPQIGMLLLCRMLDKIGFKLQVENCTGLPYGIKQGLLSCVYY
jgi:hypothetical protein